VGETLEVRVHQKGKHIMGWLSIIGQVAQVAGQVLPVILGNLGEAQASDTGYLQGDVLWTTAVDENGNLQAVARNISETVDQTLSMAVCYTEGDSSIASSTFVVLPHTGENHTVTGDFDYYRAGEACVAPSPEFDIQGNQLLTRAIAFAITSLALGLAVRIAGSLTAEVGKKTDNNGNTSYYVAIRSSEPFHTMKGNVTVADARGGSVKVEGEFKSSSASGANEWIIDLPAGVDLDPIVAQLQVNLDVEGALYKKIAAQSGTRHQVKKASRAA
jgi:hypothetical protein